MGDDLCNIGLGLGIGGTDFTSSRSRKKPAVQLHLLFPPWMKEEEEERIPTKEEEHMERPRLKKTDKEEGGTRKKLRLTKEQSTLLEESFRVHYTLTQNQKQELAERLNLRPRQVEVWFQNRRARTKLKQTEMDWEFLKKRCESLRDENRRLKRELQQLRSAKPGLPLYVQLTKATTLKMCPSCTTIVTDDEKTNDRIACPEQAQVIRLHR